MQMRCLAPDKSHDIAGTQTRELDRLGAETILRNSRMNGT